MRKNIWLFGIVFLLCIATAMAVSPELASVNSTQAGSNAMFSIFWEVSPTAGVIAKPNVANLVNGTNITAILTNIQSSDNINYTIQEAAGTDGGAIAVRFNLSAVSWEINKIVLKGLYVGNPSHTVNFDIYNYTGGTWITLKVIPSDTVTATNAWYNTTGLWGGIQFIDNSTNANTTMFRLVHVGNGVTSHYLYLDYLAADDLANLNSYIFQSDNSGIATNNSPVFWSPSTLVEGWSNVTITLNATAGQVINWKMYANTSTNSWGVYSSSFTITTPPTFTRDTCPIDSIQSTMLYIFIGMIILFFGIFAEFSRVPGLSLIAGLVCMVYSGPLYSCQIAYGLLFTIIGFVYIMWGVKWKWEKV